MQNLPKKLTKYIGSKFSYLQENMWFMGYNDSFETMALTAKINKDKLDITKGESRITFLDLKLEHTELTDIRELSDRAGNIVMGLN